MRILTNENGTWVIVPLSEQQLSEIIDLIQSSDTPYGEYVQGFLCNSWTKERVRARLDEYQGHIILQSHNLSLLSGIYGWRFNHWSHIEAYIHNLDADGKVCKAPPHMWKLLEGDIELYQARVWELRSNGVEEAEAHRRVRQLMPEL